MFAPLLELPLADTLQQLDNLHSAKLEVSLAYAIHDLLWMYLKIKGVDANGHPVVQELTRLKAYFKKIQDAENQPAEQRKLAVDKDAAARFINHALSAARKLQDADEEAKTTNEPYEAMDVVNPNVFTNAGKTTMLKWASKESKKLDQVGQGSEDGEESDLEMFNDDAKGNDENEGEVKEFPGRSHKSMPVRGEPSEGKIKVKRGRQDPLAGYDVGMPSSDQPPKKKKKKKRQD
ncbi:hypothetical protein DACRYDRAFT_23587 [Dacryopinax primogenitus]|uniref:Exosome complex protein n=1 Tax=Dacryopinax primogenitus (strain DJM 731) TaxID=1858805 RepID=M5G8I1_DACPD|nr:uncharacterized protein DACRYDRAFT_23587 [Dacryopinax primogenitus]EJU00073.1 hypothetical protein DACRYDRAFT_23587 [Dacryopinax primogenitus]